MSVYYKEIPSNLEQCLQSLASQTMPANEVVIIKDGRLNEGLDKTLEKWKNKLPLEIYGYNENKGLSYALNYGLQYCSYELVARMDSDDICLPNRFEKQINYLRNQPDIVLLSGYISEFNNYPNDIRSIRKVPINAKEIVKYLKKRNAFNHVAVMFKKSAILSVGSYRDKSPHEDYGLWIRLVQAQYKVANIPEVLSYVRIGSTDMFLRRSGVSYLLKEISFYNLQRRKHFITSIEFIILIFTRIPVRILPSKIMKYVYYFFLREKK
jgi:glycosyltransferase involved in cell wall biosynthesis